MYRTNRKYDVGESLLNELRQSFTDQQRILYELGDKVIKIKFVDVVAYDSYHNASKKDNLPLITLSFKSTKILFECSIHTVLKYYSGFTPEQEKLIRKISDICEEQDQKFFEENRELLKKENEEQLKKTLAKVEKIKTNVENPTIPIARVESTDENGQRVSKSQWMKLYDSVIDGFPRSLHEQRAVIYNGVLYCNASRAMIDYDMDPKNGHHLYATCERGHKYKGRSSYYASPEQILSYIDQTFTEE